MMAHRIRTFARRILNPDAGVGATVLLALALSAASHPAQAQVPDQGRMAAASNEFGARGRGYVGQVQGSQAFIALQVVGSQANVFVCDGTRTSISSWQWFSGPINNGTLDATTPEGEHLSAQLGGGGFTGTVTLGDKQAHRFQAAGASGSAGLFRTDFSIEGEPYQGSWIVSSDGQTRGGIMDKRGKKKPLIVIIAILIG